MDALIETTKGAAISAAGVKINQMILESITNVFIEKATPKLKELKLDPESPMVRFAVQGVVTYLINSYGQVALDKANIDNPTANMLANGLISTAWEAYFLQLLNHFAPAMEQEVTKIMSQVTGATNETKEEPNNAE